MSKNIVTRNTLGPTLVHVLDNNGSVTGTLTVSKQCAYCDKPAKIYVWCREHLIDMARLKYNTNEQEVIS